MNGFLLLELTLNASLLNCTTSIIFLWCGHISRFCAILCQRPENQIITMVIIKIYTICCNEYDAKKRAFVFMRIN